MANIQVLKYCHMVIDVCYNPVGEGQTVELSLDETGFCYPIIKDKICVILVHTIN